MKLWFKWFNALLELLWNKIVRGGYPVEYYLNSGDVNWVVTHWVKVGETNKKFIFVSRQISYLRVGGLFHKRARLYRIEVIEELDEKTGGYPSRVFMIPELCASIFKHTLVPHSCAINFVISKLS